MYKTIIQEDANGQFIVLDPLLLEDLGWNEHTILSINLLDNGKIELKKKLEWTIEDMQDNIEMVLEDIEHNETVHTITDKDGKQFKMIPYSQYKEGKDMINKIKHESFVKDLLEVAQKHKVNLDVNYDFNNESFTAEVNGAWPIKKVCDAVTVYNKKEQHYMSVPGTKD